MAEDGRNPPVRVYADAPVTIAHAWSEAWQANLHAAPAFRQLDLSWDKHTNPDVDSYRLNVSPPPYTETLAITVTNRITYTLESLSPGATYRAVARCGDADPVPARHVTLRADLGHDNHRRLHPAARLPAPITVAGAVVTESLLVTSAAQPFPEMVSLFPGSTCRPASRWSSCRR